MKAKAWIDLDERKNNGEKIDSKDVKKHRNDTVRLSQLLTAGKTLELPTSLKKDMTHFIEKLGKSEVNPKDMMVQQTLSEVILRIRESYNL